MSPVKLFFPLITTVTWQQLKMEDIKQHVDHPPLALESFILVQPSERNVVTVLCVRSFGVPAEEETSRLSRQEGKKGG